MDGSKLPNITFDIGESYAGSLPIGSSNSSELFFWFFPSADASVKKEIVIWFTGGVSSKAKLMLSTSFVN